MLCYNCMRDKGDKDVCPFCNTGALNDPQLHQLPPGSVIGGRYTVGKVLGEGGFGITYIGLDNTLDIVVAVKEYFPYGCSHRSSNITAEVSVSGGSGEIYRKGKDRFLKEAKTVAKFLKDPGIVDIRDFFEENNTAYIVMEYLEGVDLRRYLKSHGTMEPEEAFRLLTPVMRSLEKMHRVGIIHRDISPDNIMYQPDGTLKLMDFGAARDYDDSRSMSVMLKHGYAPEEQYRRGGEQGPWTDVYGLCATIYRCITGKAPDEAIDRLAEDNLKKPSELGVAISPELEKALMYGLAVRKKDRCPDMTELLRLIDEALNAEKKEAPAAVIKPAEKEPAEEVKTAIADQPDEGEIKTTLAAGVSAEAEIKTTLATDAPVEEEIKTTLATDAPVEEKIKTTLATDVPVEEEIKTTLATDAPAEEDEKTTLAQDQKDRTLAADMTVADDPEPLIPEKPPVTSLEIPAEIKKEKKRFPKVIIAVAAVLVAAIMILVIVNLFGKDKGKVIDSQAKAMSDYVNGQLDLTDYNYKDYRYENLVWEEYRGKNPASISAGKIEIDENRFPVELGKTTVGDLKGSFSAANVEENSFDDGNAYEVEFNASGFWQFRVETELFKKPHLEMGMAYCAVKDLILDYDSAESKRITPFRYQSITDKSSLKETVAQLGEPDEILLNTDDNNKAKEVRSTITLSYHGDGGFSAEFRFIYDSEDDSAKMYNVQFCISDYSNDSDEATEASRPVPNGETFELKDQDGAYTFSLQAYKDASLTYKNEEYSDRTALVVTSDKKEYSVYVYINNGYKNNYDAKLESGKEDGGVDVKAGDYSGYTYPKTALNAAFFDTGAKVKKETDIVTMVVEQSQPYKHDINEVIADEELVDLLGTLKLIKSPVE